MHLAQGHSFPGRTERHWVTIDLWESVNQTPNMNRASQIGKKHLKQEPLLQSLIRCAECGTLLVASGTKRRGRRHTYYVCPRARRRDGCEQPPVAAQDIELSVGQRLEATVGSEAERDWRYAGQSSVYFMPASRGTWSLCSRMVRASSTRYRGRTAEACDQDGRKEPEGCRESAD